jgi:type I restriction enzyme R subunit
LAIDDQEVYFCTHLQGKASWFLPFNQGWNDGAGNPPNPDGLKTAYLWENILNRESLTNILENFAQIVIEKDPKTDKKKRKQIWPRYHQLDVVRRLLQDVAQNGVGRRYLIQHSAGSGKSNSIAWLAHQLVALRRFEESVFDSVIVVTDRRVLDQQICANIKHFMQVSATVGHAEQSGDLRKFLASGKKIIITTIQKFPFILDELGNEQRGKPFAILIDEAHSSQGGQNSAAIGRALSAQAPNPEDSPEDQINRLIEARKLLPNVSYFAFTATPKNKTLELFGVPDPQADGAIKHRPFHGYTMKQAIQEGFILDVLACYTPVASYYRLAKTIAEDPEFDRKKALKKLRQYVEGHDRAIRLKTEIMADHFREQVIAQGKIGGQARAMIVTNGIKLAIQYFHAFQTYLRESDSPYQAIVAFSGEYEYDKIKVTEASLNGFPSGAIAEKIQTDPYRFLICADKFQTGYDEPLLHTLYVDKTLSGIKAVQTLSRLNRAHPQKYDVFVLDFVNDLDTIRNSFTDFYRTTILADETDRNKLNDLQFSLDQAEVYASTEIDQFVERYLTGAQRNRLDPILDLCVARYLDHLDQDEQIAFKGQAKAFIRAYGFLSALLPRQENRLDWEKRSIFLNFLVPKLPAPAETDLSRGILEAIDMESYRVEKQTMQRILLPDQDAEIDPVPTQGGAHQTEPELARLSQILQTFNDLFGNIPWEDPERVVEMIADAIPVRVANDQAYQNAQKNSDPQAARLEHDQALQRVMVSLMRDDMELFKQFMDNESFRRWLADLVFDLTYNAQ